MEVKTIEVKITIMDTLAILSTQDLSRRLRRHSPQRGKQEWLEILLTSFTNATLFIEESKWKLFFTVKKTTFLFFRLDL